MSGIEVGDYVRTKNGEIHKVIEIKENRYITNFADYFYYRYDNNMYRYDNNMGGFKSNIANHSKQLIDLIKVGDIVNGMEVLDIHKPRDLWEPIEIRVDSRYTNFILAEDIKTILTKESYMANCYKEGEEDE